MARGSVAAKTDVGLSCMLTVDLYLYSQSLFVAVYLSDLVEQLQMWPEAFESPPLTSASTLAASHWHKVTFWL
jgi:hypothetical protein